MRKESNVLEYKNYKKKKPKKKLFRIFFLLFLLFFILLIFCLFSPIFNITKIDVKGTNRLDKQLVLDMSGIKSGTNIFKVNSIYAKRMILKNPYAEIVHINRIFPDKISIDIARERVPTGYIRYMSSYVLFDKKGVILEVTNNLKDQNLIELIGTSAHKYTLGDSVFGKDMDKLKMVLDIMSSVKQGTLSIKIDSINIKDINRITMYIDKRFEVILGSMNDLQANGFYKRLLFLEKIVEREKQGTIDLSNQDRPSFRPN